MCEHNRFYIVLLADDMVLHTLTSPLAPTCRSTWVVETSGVGSDSATNSATLSSSSVAIR